MKDETHDKIDNGVDEDGVYKIDKMILDKKERRKHSFERKLKYIYDIKR